MSVIEKTARAIQLANCNKPIGGIIEDDTWQFYIPLAKGALQCLSSNIDAGAVEAAYKEFIEVNNTTLQDDHLLKIHEILKRDLGKAIQAYLNTISKE